MCAALAEVANNSPATLGTILLLSFGAGIAYLIFRVQQWDRQRHVQLEETARKQAQLEETARNQRQAEIEDARRQEQRLEEIRRRAEHWQTASSQAQHERDARRQAHREAAARQQRQITTLQQLYGMTGWQFEEFLADFLQSRGYQAHVTRGSGDQGVDILLTKEGYRIAVQAKLWKSAVSNKAVQEVFSGMTHYNTQEAWVITPSSFTQSAKDLARSTGVSLIDGTQLAQWLTEQNPSYNARSEI